MLSERLKRGPLPIADALQIAHEIAEALEFAHRHGIVHRDIEPPNILVGDQGHVKITDFGIAKQFRKDETIIPDWTASESGDSPASSPLYVTPEQLRGGPVDQRTDIFLLGIVLWEMITGSHPFKRNSEIATKVATLYDNPPYDPEIPEHLDEVLGRMLAKEPVNRYQSIRELLPNLRVSQETPRLETSTGTPRVFAVALYSLAAAGFAVIILLMLMHLGDLL